MDSKRLELLLMTDVLTVITISPLHKDVTLGKQALEFLDMLIHRSACGEHQPGETGGLQFPNQLFKGIGPIRSLFDDFPDAIRRPVIGDDLMSSFEQSSCHVHSHTSESDHTDLHKS